MNKQVEQIRAEIERLKESGCASPIVICDTLLAFIDSMREESKPKFKVGQTITDPTDSTFTFHINKIEDGRYIEKEDEWVLIKEADANYELVEEPVSEDMDKAAFQAYLEAEDKESYTDTYIDGFKAGAKWDRQLLTKNAVKGVVHHFGDDEIAAIHYNDPKGVPMSYFISSDSLKAGDNVKLITIKEERI